MAVSINIQGLENFQQALINLKQDIPEINKNFLQDEFEIFKKTVQPLTPVDTGHMQESYFYTPVRQEGNNTEQGWYNNAGEHDVEKDWLNPYTGKRQTGYSQFVNYGTVNQKPQYFFEKGMIQAEEGRQERYNNIIADKLDSYADIKANIEIEEKNFPDWQRTGWTR